MWKNWEATCNSCYDMIISKRKILGPFHIYLRLLGISCPSNMNQGTVQPHAASANPPRRRWVTQRTQRMEAMAYL